MSFTLEEARTLAEFAKQKSIAKTAEALHKSNSAIVYALDSIEEKTNFPVLDRSGYRTVLTSNGERVLSACHQLLEASRDLSHLCHELADGWESDLTLIMEGLFPLRPVLRTVRELTARKIPTRFHFFAEFLGSVETTFAERDADLMISVLNPQLVAMESIPLAEIPALLVANRDHPLVAENTKWSTRQMASYPILTVRGSAPQLNMSTAIIETKSTIQLNDFHSKKLAITKGLGYGWMPHYLIESELASGALKVVKWAKTSKHVFKPYLYFRSKRNLGKAGKIFIENLKLESFKNRDG